jgi:hypothetical protein
MNIIGVANLKSPQLLGSHLYQLNDPFALVINAMAIASNNTNIMMKLNMNRFLLLMVLTS